MEVLKKNFFFLIFFKKRAFSVQKTVRYIEERNRLPFFILNKMSKEHFPLFVGKLRRICV